MDCYLETFAKAVDARIISPYQNFRVYTKATAKNKNLKQPNGTSVYFLFEENRLVYIGMTGSLPWRINQHACNSKMKFDTVLVLFFDQFGITSHVPWEVELMSIELFRPMRNLQRNPDYKKQGHKYIYSPTTNV